MFALLPGRSERQPSLRGLNPILGKTDVETSAYSQLSLRDTQRRSPTPSGVNRIPDTMVGCPNGAQVTLSPMPFGVDRIPDSVSNSNRSGTPSLVSNAFRRYPHSRQEARPINIEGLAESPMPFGASLASTPRRHRPLRRRNHRVTNAFRRFTRFDDCFTQCWYRS